MRFTELRLRGAFIIDIDRHDDDRGFFARAWSREQFSEYGLETELKECGISFNVHRATLRGLHYQLAPFEEAKLVRCTRGAVYDVIVDLRPGSTSGRQWVSVELSEDNRRLLYVPKGFAHGFQTLVDRSEVFYQMSEVYSAAHAVGVRWDDPSFGISWPPSDDRILSMADRGWPLLTAAA